MSGIGGHFGLKLETYCIGNFMDYMRKPSKDS